MKKCLCLLEFDIPTGFATVSKNLINQFIKKLPNVYFDVVSVDYLGKEYFYNEKVFVFSNDSSFYNDLVKKQINDTFEITSFLTILAQNDYEYIFIVNDISVGLDIAPILNRIKREKKAANKKQFKSFFYFPIDAEFKGLSQVFNAKESDVETLNEQDKEFYLKYNIGLEFYDKLATYTNFGREVIYKNNPNLKGKVSIIPHGTDLSNFKPLSYQEKKEFREQLFGENADKLIFLNLNRNQPRKDLFSTIMAFEDAVQNWQHERKPYLYLHAIPHKDGINLKYVLQQTFLKENIHYQILDDKHPIWNNEMPNAEMINKVYNSCDIGITTATGGGWELFITECYATKLPLICPNHTSFKELSCNEKYSKLLKNLYPCCNQFDNTIREQIDIYELSEVMVNVPKEIEEYYIRASAAYDYVKDKLSWNLVSNSFIEWF